MLRRYGLMSAATVVTVLIVANLLSKSGLYIFAGATAVSAVAGIILRKRLRSGFFLYSSIWAFVGITVYLLFFSFGYERATALDGAEAKVCTVVTDVSGSAYTLRVKSASVDGRSVTLPGSIRCYMTLTDAQECDEVIMSVALSLPEDNGGFFGRIQLRADGIYLTGKPLEVFSVVSPERASAATIAADIREYVRTTLLLRLGRECGGLAVGVLTGYKELISPSVAAGLARCGMSHIAAVSGLHLSVLSMGLFSILSRLHRRIAAVAASFAVVCLVSVVAGFSPSVLRAGIMAIILLSGQLFRKIPDPLNSLGAASTIIVLINPFFAVDVSFLLSASATLGIVILAPKLTERVCTKLSLSGTGAAIAGVACVSACAALFTLPVSAVFFPEVSIVSPIANTLCNVPVMLSVVSGALLCLFSAVPALGTVIAVICRLCMMFIIEVSGFISQFPVAAVSVKRLPFLIWLGFCACVGIVTAGALRNNLSPLLRRAIAIVCALGYVATSGVVRMSSADRLRIICADTGRADCHLVYTDDLCLLLDCGNARAIDMMSDRLKGDGRYSIDAFVVTDFSDDYSAAAVRLLNNFSVKCLYIPASLGGNRHEIVQSAAACGTRVEEVDEPRSIDIGEISLTLMPYSEDKNAGLVATVSYGDFDMLYMSHAGAAAERLLVRTGNVNSRCELLIAGHNGIKDSCNDEFLKLVKPQATVITAGTKKAYSYDRCTAFCPCVVQTGLDGEVRISAEYTGEFELEVSGDGA